jgi:3-oxoadipate enol-lactonase
MNRVKANGIEINYRLEGPDGAPVLMLSNSLLTDYTMWDLQVPAFTQKYRLLRYDSRGHGDTEATAGPYSMGMLAADAVGLLDALRIEKVHFMGLSKGGMIAQLVASKYGGRLYSVCLSDTACQMPPPSVWDDRIRMAQEKGTSAFVQPMIERWLTEPYRKQHPEMLEKLKTMISRTSVNGMVGCCHAIKNMDHRPILGGIKVPTLVIVGDLDVGTPVSAAEVLHKEIRHSQLKVIKQAAHLPNIEHAELFNRTVMDFLQSV